MKKAKIGITCNYIENKIYTNRLALGLNYADSVRLGGGIPFPLAIPAYTNDEKIINNAIEEYISFIDGIILIGGPDISPHFYNEKKLPTVGNLSNHRAEFDLKIAKICFDRNIPILGVCLGYQEINLAAGGSLYQDIPYNFPDWSIRHAKKLDYSFTRHKVRIKRDTLLFSIIGKEEIDANSSHHQAIKSLGKDLIISAESPDGILEAIEMPKNDFILGVQWHPEYIAAKEEDHLKIFKALVSAASNYVLKNK